jgi:membrane protein implicated in regulation of membrane protease activity
MGDWVVWLIVAGALGAGEVLTLTFVLGMLAGGAAAAALTAALGAPVVGQAVVFALVSVLLLALVLPAARRHSRSPASTRSGAAALVGRRGRALTEIGMTTGGQVKLGGETWTARPYDETLVIAAGEWVDVLAIDGATAVVLPADGVIA